MPILVKTSSRQINGKTASLECATGQHYYVDCVAAVLLFFFTAVAVFVAVS
ncbi:MAG: hypothetical protein QXG52_06150 [Candidatus Caldarchaeum sp.]